MKLTLRDLFWCILLMAACTAWYVERQRTAGNIAAIKRQLVHSRGDWPGITRARMAHLKRIAQLSDAELIARLDETIAEIPNAHEDFEPCLCEMQRRRLSQALEGSYRSYMKRKPIDRNAPENLEILTAWRRAQGRPDPLRVDVALAEPRDQRPNPGTEIALKFTNVDADGEPLCFEVGGDYRGGRRDKCRIRLTDPWGREVTESNYMSAIGGGFSSTEKLQPGKSARDPMVLDLRRYVAPPRSGKYHLQTFFHGGRHIAHDPDLTGLIVAQSEPIPVTVFNPHDPKPDWFPARNRPIAAILIAAALLAVASRWSAKGSADAGSVGYGAWLATVVSRDACWAVLILLVACGFWWDRKSQDATIPRLKPDAKAEWSIRFGHTEDRSVR